MRASAITDIWAPAPFEGLRRAHYGVITADPASHFSSYTAIQSQNWSSRRDNEPPLQDHVARGAGSIAGQGSRIAERLPPLYLDKRPVPAQRAAPDRCVGL